MTDNGKYIHHMSELLTYDFIIIKSLPEGCTMNRNKFLAYVLMILVYGTVAIVMAYTFYDNYTTPKISYGNNLK